MIILRGPEYTTPGTNTREVRGEGGGETKYYGHADGTGSGIEPYMAYYADRPCDLMWCPPGKVSTLLEDIP